MKKLLAELKAINSWEHEYQSGGSHDRVEQDAHAHRRKRRWEILKEIPQGASAPSADAVSLGLKQKEMNDPHNERLQSLCERASREPDLQKLLELVSEIERLLDDEEQQKRP